MIVSTDQVRIGVKKYVENELAYKADGITKFMIYFVMPSIDKKISDFIVKAKENDMLSDMFN